MTSTAGTPRILMPARMNAHLAKRADDAFDVVRVERFDPALIDAATAATIRGITGWGTVDAALIDHLPRLEIVANYGVGYDGVDAAYAAAKGIMVTNTPDVLSDEVADTTVGLLLNTVRELPAAEAHLRAGRWPDGNYPLTRLTLRGRSVGIYGLGRIGLAIAKRLEAFGLPISYHTRTKKPDLAYPYHASLLDLARAVDTLIVAVPGGTATEKSVHAEVLKALGPNGVLINIGRGTVVDEEALIAALTDGTIAAAGLDVFADEPRVPEALIALNNVSLLPHVASASVATRDAMADLAADNLVSWFDTGKPLTPVAECRDMAKR